MAQQALFDGQTSDGNSSAVQVKDICSRTANPGIAGEHFTVHVSGTFNGVTVKLQAAPTSTGPWVDIPDGSFTEAGMKVTPLSPTFWIRGNVSGTGSPAPDVSLYAG